MTDSTVSSELSKAQGAHAGGPGGGVHRRLEWLLLTHHLPAEPAYFRVRVRRRLERIGAIPLKNSVYVLPVGDETQEDFQWLRQEIERSGGESTVGVTRFLDDVTDSRLVAAFRDARQADYEALAESIEELAGRSTDVKEGAGQAHDLTSHRARFRRELSRVEAIDFFDASGREAAELAVARLDALIRGDGIEEGRKSVRETEHFEGFVGRTWVTRAGVKVDRMSTAWLIRRFIDPAATFKFVPPQGYRPAEGEIRFDMYEGEFTHDGDACTFETMLRRFELDDPGFVALGEIVHDIDYKDDRFERPETVGIASLIEGIMRLTDDDPERLERGGALFDELFEHFSNA